jgi:hypothetical protein
MSAPSAREDVSTVPRARAMLPGRFHVHVQVTWEPAEPDRKTIFEEVLSLLTGAGATQRRLTPAESL